MMSTTATIPDRVTNGQQAAELGALPADLIGRLLAAVEPGAVFGAPMTSGAYTVFTAAEVRTGGGFGSGRGTGPAQVTDKATGAVTTVQSEGGGIGGGGGATGRPIAVIAIGPNGVTVQPIVDTTKVALAGITAATAILTMLFRLVAKRRKG
jgi:uncharacterized spore protein YtfJ